jgi:hypothetical protein
MGLENKFARISTLYQAEKTQILCKNSKMFGAPPAVRICLKRIALQQTAQPRPSTKKRLHLSEA